MQTVLSPTASDTYVIYNNQVMTDSEYQMLVRGDGVTSFVDHPNS